MTGSLPRGTFAAEAGPSKKKPCRPRDRESTNHTDILADAGWRVFLRDWRRHLQGRHGTAFSVMTAAIMERFLRHLGYRILVKDDESVPRDCVWVCQAPA